jgi:hypothetical protein
MVIYTTIRPQIDAALVGGVVGGIAVLLAIVILVAYIVMHKSRSKANEDDNGRAMQHYSDDSQSRTTRPPVSNSNYDRIDIPSHRYIERSVVAAAPTTTHYNTLEPSEI